MDKQNVPKALADSITNHLKKANKTIVARGRQYYNSGKIVSLTQTNEQRFVAAVDGSKKYNVIVDTNSKNRIVSCQCDCPYDFGSICKHIAAVLLAIHAGDFRRNTVSHTTVKELLEQTDVAELHQFLCEYADNNPDFRDMIYLRFDAVQADRILESAQIHISSEIQRIKRYDYVDEWECDKLAEFICKFLNDAEEYALRGETLVAFRLAVLVFKSAEDVRDYADKTTEDLEMLLDNAISQIDDYAKKLAESQNVSDCNTAFDEAIAVMEDCFDTLHPFVMAILPLINKDNVNRIYSVLDRIAYYFPSKDMLVRYEILNAFGDNKAVRDFIYQHLEEYEFRKKAVDMAMEQQNYNEAERLCLEALEATNNSDTAICWYERLLNIYRETNDLQKLTDIMLQLVVNGETQYYPTLREQLDDLGLWEELRPSIIPALCEKLSIDKFSDLMISEHEYRVLLDFLKISADLLAQSMIFKYIKPLSEEYPSEVCFVVRGIITGMADKANNRDAYHDVCMKLISLAEIGGKEDALDLIEQFKLQHKRKSAFIGELTQANERIRKCY